MTPSKMSVLLTTEGTYPFNQGGVSTWCDILVKRLPSVQFHIIAILTDPFVTQKYSLAADTQLTRIPLWGTDEPSEHLDVRFSSTYLAKERTTPTVIHDRFLPLFDELVGQVLSEQKDAGTMGRILLGLYEFFQEFDYKVAFKSALTWERYRQLISATVDAAGSSYKEPDLYSLIQSLGWLYRFFNIVNTRVPKTTVSHSSAAAFCGIPCVVAKLLHGTPYLLTEHGVYAREQYLSLSKRGYSSFLNTFLIRMIHSVTDLNYHFADQISPVCEYNTRWERRLMKQPDRIRVIYNGVDHAAFTRLNPRDREHPTVVTVARIDPIKDLLTLIRAASRVRERIPDVRFLVYGGVTVPSYQEECAELIRKLSLDRTVQLMGHVSNVAAAYDAGDIVVQSSISEAFPYSVIEAMFAGKPVISTAVGGIPEAIGDTGRLVNPGDDEGLANAIADLLLDKQAILELGQEARRRALDLFTLERSLSNYMRTYIRMALVESATVVTPVSAQAVRKRTTALSRSRIRSAPSRSMARRLSAERALALLDAGYPLTAIRHLNASMQNRHCHPSDLVKLAIVSSIYQRLGKEEEAARARDQLETASRDSLLQWQQLLRDRGYAFASRKHWDKAVTWMNRAIDAFPTSPEVPAMRTEIARWTRMSEHGSDSETVHGSM